jgi:hypothetical protein
MNGMSNNPFHLLQDDDSTIASGRRSSGMSLRSRGPSLGASLGAPLGAPLGASLEASLGRISALDTSVNDTSFNDTSLSALPAEAPTPSKLPPPPSDNLDSSNFAEDNSLISSVVTAHLKQRSCAVAPLTEAASSPSSGEGNKQDEEKEEDENVYMMLFSPDTTKEIKKARARVMKEEVRTGEDGETDKRSKWQPLSTPYLYNTPS